MGLVEPIPHAVLVKAARQWLQVRCKVVASECSGVTREVPDAIGWMANEVSVLIECKTSRQDFFSDRKKSFRRLSELGLGMVRYYLTPKGLVRANELPDKWGLLEYIPSGHRRGYFIRQIVESERRELKEFDSWGERRFLINAVYRSMEALRLLKPFAIGQDEDEKETSVERYVSSV